MQIKRIKFNEHLSQALEQLKDGAFLTVRLEMKQIPCP